MNTSNRIGMAKGFKVFPGDVINASVQAYYSFGSGLSQAVATTIAAAVSDVLSPTQVVDGVVTDIYEGDYAGIALSPFQGSSKPSAFLNYILFDQNYVPIAAQSQPLGGTANVIHTVQLPTINVKELGYLFVYLSYDNTTDATVYFDDLKIVYSESPVIQVNGYYPYGMTAYSWARDGEEQTKNKYQGKEYDSLTQWHDFHSRQYDATVGRWFANDPQNQFASPYCALGNNPQSNVDPNGEFVFTALAAIFAPPLLPLAIGADLGMWSGGSLANGTGNPFKWDYHSGKTWGYMAGGAIAGGVSGGIAGDIAASGIPFANTAAAFTGSFINSVGTSIYSGGQTDVSISFGMASYNFTQNDWGILGGKGNSALENVSYGLGAFSLASDLTAFAQGAYNSADNIRLKTDAHSEFEDLDGNQIFSFGALNDDGSKIITKPAFKHLDLIGKKFANDITNYKNGVGDGLLARKIAINRLNMNEFYRYKNSIESFRGESYRFASIFPRLQNSMHCTVAASRALLNAGVFNIPLLRMPWFLDLQMRVRDYSYLSYFTNR